MKNHDRETPLRTRSMAALRNKVATYIMGSQLVLEGFQSYNDRASGGVGPKLVTVPVRSEGSNGSFSYCPRPSWANDPPVGMRGRNNGRVMVL